MITCPHCDEWVSEHHKCLRSKRSPEYEAMLRRVVERAAEEERMLAAMTPAERERWIANWAANLADRMVEDGCSIDRALAGTPPAEPGEGET